MLCKLTLAAGSKFLAGNFLHNGARIKGKTSGATGIVYITPQDVTFTTTGGNITNNSKTITMTNTGGIEPGMGITATATSGGATKDIGTGNYIDTVDSVTQCTLKENAGETVGSNACTFQIGNVVYDTDVATSTGDGKKYTIGTTFHVIHTTGTFHKGEVITSNITQSSFVNFDTGTDGEATLDATISPLYYSMADAHSIYGKGEQNTGYDYRANICPKDVKKLSGTVSAATGGAAKSLTGTNTYFTSDLKIGDLFEVQDTSGVVRRFTVDRIENDYTLHTVETFPNQVSSSTILRKRSMIEEQEE